MKATNASQMATGPKIARRVPQAMPSLPTNRSLEEGLPSSPEQEAGAPALKMTMLDD